MSLGRIKSNPKELISASEHFILHSYSEFFFFFEIPLDPHAHEHEGRMVRGAKSSDFTGRMIGSIPPAESDPAPRRKAGFSRPGSEFRIAPLGSGQHSFTHYENRFQNRFQSIHGVMGMERSYHRALLRSEGTAFCTYDLGNALKIIDMCQGLQVVPTTRDTKHWRELLPSI